MPNNFTQEDLTNKLHQMLVKDLEINDSEINRFIDNTALHLILTNLQQDKRLDFYKFLAEDNFDKAQNLVLSEVPEFNTRLAESVKERFKEIL